MIEDKLSTEQRIRLEALNQARLCKGGLPGDPNQVLAVAALFRDWIKTGEVSLLLKSQTDQGIPFCANCGCNMYPEGSTYRCQNCGETSGCS